MKQLNLIFIVILLGCFNVSDVSAYQTSPRCVAVGTAYEGWVLPGEEFKIRADRCADKIMECAAIGTRAEGWYVFEKQNIKCLQPAACRFETAEPICMFIGTPNEGWVVPARGMRIYYQACAGQGVECADQNHNTEGWYIFNKKLIGLFMYSKCGSH